VRDWVRVRCIGAAWQTPRISVLFLCYIDLQEVDVIAILGPFLDVIRSEDTTGPITGYALSAVNKFLCYGLIGKPILM
jgi:hypothetical protein